MKRASVLTSAALAAACAGLAFTPLAAQDAGDVEAKAEATPAPMTKGEKRLAKLLEGRVAGEPVRCINVFRNVEVQTIEGTAYVYGRGHTIWVQRTRNPEDIDDRDYLQVLRRDSSRLCRDDQTLQVEPVTGMMSGVLFFQDFVPYTRVKPEAAGEG